MWWFFLLIGMLFPLVHLQSRNVTTRYVWKLTEKFLQVSFLLIKIYIYIFIFLQSKFMDLSIKELKRKLCGSILLLLTEKFSKQNNLMIAPASSYTVNHEVLLANRERLLLGDTEMIPLVYGNTTNLPIHLLCWLGWLKQFTKIDSTQRRQGKLFWDLSFILSGPLSLLCPVSNIDWRQQWSNPDNTKLLITFVWINKSLCPLMS